jgi:hypothetical protein
MTPAKAGGPAARSGSQQRVESHEISDPVSAPPRSKISKSAAAAVAKTIWDRRLGVSDVVLKTATKHHFQTLDRKGIAMQHVARRFLTEIAWPDDHTPLPRCASAAQVTAILDSAHDVLDAMGLTRPPPRPAVERGHAAQ